MNDPHAQSAPIPEQPAEPPRIQHAAIPTSAPQNPYRRNELTDSAMSATPGPDDLRARGFDGDAFDSLLRSRWIEGCRVGRHDGIASATANYPDIYDEGYRAAAGQFYIAGLRAVAPVLLECRRGLGRLEEKISEGQDDNRLLEDIAGILTVIDSASSVPPAS